MVCVCVFDIVCIVLCMCCMLCVLNVCACYVYVYYGVCVCIFVCTCMPVLLCMCMVFVCMWYVYMYEYFMCCMVCMCVVWCVLCVCVCVTHLWEASYPHSITDIEGQFCGEKISHLFPSLPGLERPKLGARACCWQHLSLGALSNEAQAWVSSWICLLVPLPADSILSDQRPCCRSVETAVVGWHKLTSCVGSSSFLPLH